MQPPPIQPSTQAEPAVNPPLTAKKSDSILSKLKAKFSSNTSHQSTLSSAPTPTTQVVPPAPTAVIIQSNKASFLQKFSISFNLLYDVHHVNANNNNTVYSAEARYKKFELKLHREKGSKKEEGTPPNPFGINNFDEFDRIGKKIAKIIFNRFESAIQNLNEEGQSRLTKFFIRMINDQYASSNLNGSNNTPGLVQKISRCMTTMRNDPPKKLDKELSCNDPKKKWTIEEVIFKSPAYVYDPETENSSIWTSPPLKDMKSKQQRFEKQLDYAQFLLKEIADQEGFRDPVPIVNPRLQERAAAAISEANQPTEETPPSPSMKKRVVDTVNNLPVVPAAVGVAGFIFSRFTFFLIGKLMKSPTPIKWP